MFLLLIVAAKSLAKSIENKANLAQLELENGPSLSTSGSTFSQICSQQLPWEVKGIQKYDIDVEWLGLSI